MKTDCSAKPTVFVIDDDAGVRHSLRLLMESVGHAVACFGSAEAFLHAYRPQWRGCVVLDMNLGAGMRGSGLHEALDAMGSTLAVIYLTAHADVPAAVQAMRRGAVDFLVKPVAGQVLLERVGQALASQYEDPAAQAACPALDCLTPREQEIAQRVLAGLGNKAIARELAISHRTVEYHRTQILHKTGASSFIQLASRLASPPAVAEGRGQTPASA